MSGKKCTRYAALPPTPILNYVMRMRDAAITPPLPPNHTSSKPVTHISAIQRISLFSDCMKRLIWATLAKTILGVGVPNCSVCSFFFAIMMHV